MGGFDFAVTLSGVGARNTHREQPIKEVPIEDHDLLSNYWQMTLKTILKIGTYFDVKHINVSEGVTVRVIFNP